MLDLRSKQDDDINIFAFEIEFYQQVRSFHSFIRKLYSFVLIPWLTSQNFVE